VTEIPYGIATYCDDIRMEIGGKLTLVGCYTGEMTVFGNVPLVLPTFCTFVNFRVPTETEFDKIEIKLSIDLGEVSKELASAEFQNPNKGAQIEAKSQGASQHISINLPIKLSPLLIEGEGFIRCRAYIDYVEYKLGSLKIIISDPATMDPTLNPLTPAKS
jgi:hypothetical protein